MFLLLAILLVFLLVFGFWGAIVFWASLRLATVRRLSKSTESFVAAVGFTCFQLVVVFWSIVICTHLLSGRPLADDLLVSVFLSPVVVPATALRAWNTFYSFLSVPLFVSLGIAVGATLVWIKFASRRLRQFWPGIALAFFLVTGLAAGQVQYQRDVTAAAKRLSPECLDGGSFVDAIAGHNRFRLHARAVKVDEIYAWSFRERDFYRLPKGIDRNVSLKRAPLLSKHPSCWPAKVSTRH
jgi:hypothetical protein